MNSKIKNIIIFVVIAAALILAYVFFFKKDTTEPNLVGTSTTSTTENSAISKTNMATEGAFVSEDDFLALLLSVKGIKLDDTIFSDVSFGALSDSSIKLIPDGNEGRPNPFAPIGIDTPLVKNNESVSNVLIPNEKGILDTEGSLVEKAKTTDTTSTSTKTKGGTSSDPEKVPTQ